MRGEGDAVRTERCPKCNSDTGIEQGPRVSLSKTRDVGGCNFCSDRTESVYVVESRFGLQVRFCRLCIDDTMRQMRSR